MQDDSYPRLRRVFVASIHGTDKQPRRKDSLANQQKDSMKKGGKCMTKAVANIRKDTVIVNLAKCVELLRQCTRAEDAKKLMDIGVAAKVWAERQRLGVEAQNSTTEFVLRAERHIGELLKQTERHQGGRPGKKPVTRGGQVSKLKETGISRNLSSRAQRIASVPADKFEAAIGHAKKQGQEISRTKIVNQLTRPSVSDIKRRPHDEIADATIVTETASPADEITARIRTFLDEQLRVASKDVRVKVALALRDYASRLMKKNSPKLETGHGRTIGEASVRA